VLFRHYGFGEGYPEIDLGHTAQTWALITEPAAFATEPGLLDRLERRWRPLTPVHRWLVDHVQDTATAR
jgi:hypothetical protein